MIQPKLVVIGGGSGSFNLLQELKKWTPNITAVVNMSDDGGSSGLLRDELGVLPPGDIRQCLVALSNYPASRDLFSYRFNEGKLGGHSVGNIILSALELQSGSFTQAVKIVAELLQITGQVIPVTTEKHTLILTDGQQTIKGESLIGQHQIKHLSAKVHLEPAAKINPEAAQAINQAQLVIIAPGNIYCSLLPALSVKGMATALKQTKAKIVFMANLINKPKQTLNWHVVDYVKQIERYIGSGTIDAVLYNNALPKRQLLQKYAEDQEFPVRIDAKEFSSLKIPAVGASLVAKRPYKQDPHDTAIKRTLIRHDAYESTQQLKLLMN